MDVKFSNNKHIYIVISDNGNRISNESTSDAALPHCYLNTKLENGIHHIVYKSHSETGIYFGCSTNNDYHGHFIYNDESSCSICMNKDKCILYGSMGEICREKNINEMKCRKEGEYEIIYNMSNHTIMIREGNGKEMLIFKKIESTVYPFVCLDKKSSVSIIKYYKE